MLRWMTRVLGPVFAKEMVEMARRKRYYLNRVIFGLGLLCALGIAWENSSWQFSYGRPPLLQDLANLAHTMFVAVATVQYIAVFVFVPPLLCGVVASEREAHTLDLLLTTQMNDREIVLGKLGSRLWVVMLLMLSGLPVMNIIMLFGGVDPASVWRVQATTLLAMLYAGAHSIYFSSATRSPLGALVRTYWWMALWLLALPMVIIILERFFNFRPGSPGAIFIYVLVLVNPLFSFMAAIERFTYQQFSQLIGAWFFPGTFIVPAAWSLLLMWRAVVRLRWIPKQYTQFAAIARWFRERRSEAHRRSRERKEARGAPSWLASENPLWRRARLSHAYDRDGHLRKIQWAGWAITLFFLALLAVTEPSVFRQHGGPFFLLSALWILIAWSKAAISIVRFVTEGKHVHLDATLKVVGWLQWAGLAAATFLLLLLNFFDPFPRYYREEPAVFLAVIWIVIAVLTAVVSAGSLVGDRRRGFFDMVLTTPLEPRKIIDGTLLAVWQHLRHGYFLAWSMTLLFVICGSAPVWGALLSMTLAMLFGLVIAMLGVLCSLVARNVTAALVPTIAFPFLVCIGPPLLLGSVEEHALPILRVATIVALAASLAFVRWRVNVWTVAALFTATHFALAGIGQFWSDGGRHNDIPILGMNPAALTVMTLADELEREMEKGGGPYDAMSYLPSQALTPWAKAHFMLACECLALLGTFLWSRWWAIRHFDQLVGRRDKLVTAANERSGANCQSASSLNGSLANCATYSDHA